jgi:hypothetical protein
MLEENQCTHYSSSAHNEALAPYEPRSWKRTLDACTTSREADKVLAEVARRFPDPKEPARTEALAWHAATMARLRQGRPSKRDGVESLQATPGPQEVPIDKPNGIPSAGVEAK